MQVRPAFLVLLLALVPACWDFGESPDAGNDPGGASIAGRILVASSGQYAPTRSRIEQTRARIAVANERAEGAASASVASSVAPMPMARPGVVDKEPDYEFRRGEINVLFQKGAFDTDGLMRALHAMRASAHLDDVRFDYVNCAARRLCTFTMTRDGALLSLDDTTRAAKALHASRVDGIQVVARNFVKRGFRVPNDPYYFYQWHYEFAHLPAAWDITTGDANLVVAVVDSGLIISHPDIAARVLQGADTITETQVANDENGRDTDPTDPGDNLFGNGQHSFHGTHVAGTIGAETDNGEGVAGVTWAGFVLPVRALGMGLSGADSDILAGVLWAVGEPDIDGLPPNQTPAKVVNLSLGGATDPQGTEIWQEVITAITVDADNTYGHPLVVCAAGNSDALAETIVPANLDHMITVGATRYDGQRASYSNRGDAVDLMAPGGDESVDLNADGYGDGVLSLYSNEYNYEQGTSMSSPHVAGVLGLLASISPDIDQATAEQLLKDTADASGQCNEGCGAGHLDAVAALVAAGGTISPDPRLAVDQSQVFFGLGIAQATITVRNLGNSPLEVTAEVTGAQAQLFTIAPSSVTVDASGVEGIVVTLTRGSFGAGNANIELTGQGAAAGQTALVNLGFDDGEIAPPPSLQTIEVGAYQQTAEGVVRKKTAIATSANNFEWKIEGLAAGDYFVFAVADEDNDGVYDAQRESVGAYPLADSPKVVTVGENAAVTGIDFALQSGFVIDNPGGVGAPCLSNGDCTFAPDAECITSWTGGYCSRVCLEDGYCGANASCENLICDGNTECAVCLASCVTVSQCRGEDGFTCDPYDTCTPNDFPG